MSSNHRGLTRLFPRHWRTRYGKEIADLVEDMKEDKRGFRLRDRLDLTARGFPNEELRSGVEARILPGSLPCES